MEALEGEAGSALSALNSAQQMLERQAHLEPDFRNMTEVLAYGTAVVVERVG